MLVLLLVDEEVLVLLDVEVVLDVEVQVSPVLKLSMFMAACYVPYSVTMTREVATEDRPHRVMPTSMGSKW